MLPRNAQRRERGRRATATAVAAIAARGLLLAATVFAIPLSVGYLGVERYGIFVALTSLTAMLLFADLGLGNGLMNVISDALGRNDRSTAQRSVSSATFMLIGVAILLVAIAILIYPLVDWSALFGASTPETAAEVGPAAAVLIGLYLIGLPLGMSERVRLGFQEGFINSIFAMIGTIASIGGLVLAILLQASLPWLVVAVVLPPVAALAVNTVKLFLRDRPWLAPRWNLASRAMVLRLAHVGFLFFALQVAVVVAFQSDVLVAAAVLGPDAAATYAVTLRMFMLVPSLVGLVLLALWPAYTEAIARGDTSWVRHTLRRSVIAASAASLASSALLVVAGPALIGLLTGDRIHPPFALLIGAAIWAVVNATFNAVTVLFNAASIITFQVITASVMACGSIALSIALANTVGLPGVVWGTLIAYITLSAIPITLDLPRVMRRLDNGRIGARHDA